MTHGTKRAAEAYDTIESHEELIRWSWAYHTRAVAAHGLDVMLGPVCWEVPTRAKRRAAAVKTPTIENASVGRAIDWSAWTDGFGESTPFECTTSLSWRAFESFDHEEWSATFRYELVHVKQFRAFGATGHGPVLKRRAEAAGAPVRVRRFVKPKYTLSCEACSADVAYRYRECKLIRESSAYCPVYCEAPLYYRKRRE